jgi:uncharacterized protein (TIGR02996 family)
MHDETAFLNALLDSPTDDATRLVYADWLEEHSDPLSLRKAEYLRLLTIVPDDANAKRHYQRMISLARKLGQAWIVYVSNAPIEGCRRVYYAQPPCPRTWDALQPTDTLSQRQCQTCAFTVVWCETVAEAVSAVHRRRLPVVVRPDQRRQPRDLGLPVYITPEMIDRIRRLQLSRTREQRPPTEDQP